MTLTSTTTSPNSNAQSKKSRGKCTPCLIKLAPPSIFGAEVGQLIGESNNVHNAELKLFLEVELGLDLRPIAPPHKKKDDVLIFFKLYDPETEELRMLLHQPEKLTRKHAKDIAIGTIQMKGMKVINMEDPL
ncbi:uncharacterized protein LOC133288884 [Gastrolobium bilobum]|uniref:uncharacterized protein LOC133288884 n=1 Tax=Gastrolobium bilobum TaxID=150636 RepID=UPI002AB08DE9|nr:uncharacterized protein LOC133288884 [Gastrolobium bilobum]